MKKEAAVKAPEKTKKGFFSVKLFQSGSIDAIFCCMVLLLFGIGIVMMYSASYAYAGANESSASHYFKRQLLWGVLGFIAMFVISKVDYRILNSWLTPWFIIPATCFLMVVTLFVNRGKSIKRWLPLGPFSFQPSELMKFVTVLTVAYIACILCETMRVGSGQKLIPKRNRLTKPERRLYYFIDRPVWGGMLMLFTVGMFTLLVLAGKHLSGAIIVFLIGMAMMWAGGAPKSLIFAVMASVVCLFALVYFKPEILKVLSTYQYERFASWKLKQTVGTTTRWQTEQGLLAIGSGGPFGLGFGNSKQKLLYVPEPQNDFVFTIVCEELGFVGALIILILFAALIFRGLQIAVKNTDYFGSLLVVGIVMQVGIQVAVNLAVITDIFPNTGVPFPFFSYGGSSLFFLLCEMGLVLSVSRRSYLDKE